MNRFNFDANNINDAKEYVLSRAKQLLRHYFKLISIEEYPWGIFAIFEKEGKEYQSLYILKDYRNKGIFKQNVKKDIPVLTSVECQIEDFLIKNKIDHTCVSLTPFAEYNIIANYYGNQSAKRSGVHLMNHIDEGLYILEKIGASETAKKAYCLHPIVQSDESLLENYSSYTSSNFISNSILESPYINHMVIIALMEYRSVANEYLSHRNICSLDEIRLSPLKDVNDMLIADKIQNRKDFELYHKGVHARSNDLELYFDNWIKKLNISEEFYKEACKYCNFILK